MVETINTPQIDAAAARYQVIADKINAGITLNPNWVALIAKRYGLVNELKIIEKTIDNMPITTNEDMMTCVHKRQTFVALRKIADDINTEIIAVNRKLAKM